MAVSKKKVPEVCSAIEEDLRTLLQAFKEKRSLRLVKFHEVAADYNLSDVYAGRLNVAEYLEFTECFLRSAFSYAGPGNTKTPRSITERIFGIYATYVLYYGQATDYHVKIHTTSADLEILLDFVKLTLIPCRHLDAVGCIYKLVYDDAFAITPFHNDFDPVTQKKFDSTAKSFEEDHEQQKYIPMELTKSLLEDPIFKTMVRVQAQMGEIEKSSCDSNLHISENGSSFVERLEEIFAQLKEKLVNVDSEAVTRKVKSHAVANTEVADSKSRALSRSSIRERAFNSIVGSLREKRSVHPDEPVNDVVVKDECPGFEAEPKLDVIAKKEDSPSENAQKGRTESTTNLNLVRDTKSEKRGASARNRSESVEEAIIREKLYSKETKPKEPEMSSHGGEGIDVVNSFSNAISQLDIDNREIKPLEPKLDADFEVEMGRIEATLSKSYEKKLLELEQL